MQAEELESLKVAIVKGVVPTPRHVVLEHVDEQAAVHIVEADLLLLLRELEEGVVTDVVFDVGLDEGADLFHEGELGDLTALALEDDAVLLLHDGGEHLAAAGEVVFVVGKACLIHAETSFGHADDCPEGVGVELDAEG